jgi:IS30 family transposase
LHDKFLLRTVLASSNQSAKSLKLENILTILEQFAFANIQRTLLQHRFASLYCLIQPTSQILRHLLQILCSPPLVAVRFKARSYSGELTLYSASVSREVKQNDGLDGYRATKAEQRAWHRARRPKPCKLAVNRALADIVASKLQLQWSPEQIAGWLKQTYASDEGHHVSHESIYRSLYIQARGALKKELLEHLWQSRNLRRSRRHTQKTDNHGKIIDTISIGERPATAEDRAVPGHWQGDLLFGSYHSQSATLGERQIRDVMIEK